LVVGAAHTIKGLRMVAGLRASDLDVVELRVDALLKDLSEVERVLPEIRLPVLLTVRHPAEGGIGNLSTRDRQALYARFLPQAALVDVELRSIKALAEILASARKKGVRQVVSDHHFRRMPSTAELVARQRRAFRAGADIFKLAAVLPTAREFGRLMDFASRPAAKPRALMGMGTFGQVSRLALAQSGSVLNYGYLDRPNAPGQWEARELKALLSRIDVG
jgi:3-dehydroquinate dehydratase-1